MPLEVKRKPNEDSKNLIRRFSRGIRRSGILHRVRENRYWASPKSDQLKKRSALKKKELRKEYKRKKKLGKLGK